MEDDQAPAEGQIPIQMLMQVAPDLFTPDGIDALNKKMDEAKMEQPNLDKIIKGITRQLNADHSSRVKDHAVTMKKIGQKRLEGRTDYGIDDIGDSLGERIILNDSSQVPDAIKAVKDAELQGKFKILKQQHIQEESHNSEHFDLEMPSGVTAELQIIPSQQELADSVVNHDIYAMQGQNPDPQHAQLRDDQTEVIKNLSNKKAKNLANTMLQLHKANSDLPLPKIVTVGAVTDAATG